MNSLNSLLLSYLSHCVPVFPSLHFLPTGLGHSSDVCSAKIIFLVEWYIYFYLWCFGIVSFPFLIGFESLHKYFLCEVKELLPDLQAEVEGISSFVRPTPRSFCSPPFIPCPIPWLISSVSSTSPNSVL